MSSHIRGHNSVCLVSYHFNEVRIVLIRQTSHIYLTMQQCFYIKRATICIFIFGFYLHHLYLPFPNIHSSCPSPLPTKKHMFMATLNEGCTRTWTPTLCSQISSMHPVINVSGSQQQIEQCF